MARHCTRFCALIGLVFGLFPAPEALAYEEQVSLDMGLSANLLTTPQDPAFIGPGAELGVSVGLPHAFVLRANAGFAELFHKLTIPEQDYQLPYGPLVQSDAHVRQRSHIARLRAEALYQLDVLKVVPFFGLGATLLYASAVDTDSGSAVRGGGHLVAGLDYLLSRRWICGIDIRSALLGGGGHLRNMSDLTLRLSRTFETF